MVSANHLYSLMISVIDWHILDIVVLAKIKYIVKAVLFILFLGKNLIRFIQSQAGRIFGKMTVGLCH